MPAPPIPRRRPRRGSADTRPPRRSSDRTARNPSAVTRPAGHGVPQRLLDLTGQSPGGSRQVGPEQRAVLAQRVQDVAGTAGSGLGRRQVAPRGAQQPGQVVADRQRDRRGPRRGQAAAPGSRVGLAVADRQPAPGDLAGQAQLIQPLAAVAVDPGGQDRVLPGPGGQLEALQLLDNGEHAEPALAPGARVHVLPAQQEPHEVPGGDRLDLGPLPLPGVGVDAGQQPPGAELLCAVRRGEPAAEREAFVLQPGQARGRPASPAAQCAWARSAAVDGPRQSR